MDNQNFIQLSSQQFEDMLNIIKSKPPAEIDHHIMSIVALAFSVIAILLHVLPILAK